MALGTVDLTPRIGSELKLGKADLLGGAHAADIRGILEQRGVLIVRGVDLDDEEELAFAATLGTVRQDHGATIMKITVDKEQHRDNPQFTDYFLATTFWHMDGTHEDVPPLASILTPRVLSPAGGQTEFANTYAAYDDLSDADKVRFAGLRIVHTKLASIVPALKDPSEAQLDALRAYGAKAHPLVWTHRSGRKSLAMSSSADHVVGMDPAESAELIAWLRQWATKRDYVYQHQWAMGDLLIWDNTGTMHRVLPYDLDCGRRLHRVTLLGEESFAEAA
jgi:alpha-ketoglutarate-dependent taurine dioxygenase